MVVVEESSSFSASGHEKQEGNKTWVALASKSQSLVSSLLVNLLISLGRLWHWLKYLWLSEEEATTTAITNPSLSCENNPNFIIPDNQQEAQIGKEKEVSSLQEEEEEEIVPEAEEGDNKEEDTTMTIDVSSFAAHEDDAMVSSEEVSAMRTNNNNKLYSPSIPIVLRLNSESLEPSSDHDEDILLSQFENRQSSKVLISRGSEDRDSCSGYCSGSGSSLPGSPTPNSNIHLHICENEGENEVEVAALPPRRDSDAISDNSSEGNGGGDETSEEVVSRIVAQVESMFSDDHLAKDGFLLKHVRRRSDGFVSLKLVAGLRKVKQISREFSVVLNALQASEKLEVNTEGTKIRRKDSLTQELKSMPIKQAKKEKGPGDKEKNQAEKENHGNSSTDEQQIARKRRPKGDKLNELQFERGPNQYPQQYNKNTNSGRSSFSSTTDENPQVTRRRGGSLPIPAANLQKRGSTAGNYLYPNASPPNAASGFLRPKSNSYSEGTDPSGMSTWLQRRKASAASSRLSSGDISLAGVIRQPRGPDGTKGFHAGYRSLIIEERLQREMSLALSSFSA